MWKYKRKLIDLILVLVQKSKNQKIFIGADCRAFGYRPLSIANANSKLLFAFAMDKGL